MKVELKNVKIHVITVNGYEFIFFYKDTNNNKICVESCNLNTLEKQFSLSPINGPKECLITCPDNYPFYYEIDKICLKKCNNEDFYDNSICVNQCSKEQYIHPGKKCSRNPCPGDFPFYIQDNINSPKECVFSCQNEYKYYIKDGEGYKCVKEKNEQKVLYKELISEDCPL